MTEKLDIHDVLSTLVLGVLAICAVPICFPTVLTAGGPKYPDGFAVIALAAVSLFVGQLIQALGSMIEPLLFKTFGGRPSDQVLDGKLGDRYFRKEEAKRIKAKILAAMGVEQASDGSIFRFAMQRSDAAGVGRATRFNGLYAYHRGVFVLTLIIGGLLFASMRWGAVAIWPAGLRTGASISIILLLILFWYRAKQRGIYYAREVLLTAERVLDERLQTAIKPVEPPGAKV